MKTSQHSYQRYCHKGKYWYKIRLKQLLQILSESDHQNHLELLELELELFSFTVWSMNGSACLMTMIMVTFKFLVKIIMMRMVTLTMPMIMVTFHFLVKIIMMITLTMTMTYRVILCSAGLMIDSNRRTSLSQEACENIIEKSSMFINSIQCSSMFNNVHCKCIEGETAHISDFR